MPFVVVLIACVAGMAFSLSVLVYFGVLVVCVARKVQNEIAV